MDFFKFEDQARIRVALTKLGTMLTPCSPAQKYPFDYSLKGRSRLFFYRILFVLACLGVSLSPLYTKPYLFDVREVIVEDGLPPDSIHLNEQGMYQIMAHQMEMIVETRLFEFQPNYRVLQNRQLDSFRLQPHSPEGITVLLQIHKDYTCFATPGAIVVQDHAGKQLLNYAVFKTKGKAESRKFYNGAFLGRQNPRFLE